MKKTINSKHSRSVFIFALLSLFMCMSSGKVSAVQLKPVVQIENASYTRSGTEVTLKLWIFNWKLEVLNSKQYNTPIRDKIAISCMLRQIHEFSSHAIRHGLYIKNQKRFFCP